MCRRRAFNVPHAQQCCSSMVRPSAKQPASAISHGTQAPSVAPARKEKSCWTEQDESILIKYLLDCRAEASDGANFKSLTWNGAAKQLQEHGSKKGGVKTARACRDKWGRVSFALISQFPLL